MPNPDGLDFLRDLGISENDIKRLTFLEDRVEKNKPLTEDEEIELEALHDAVRTAGDSADGQ